MTNITPSFTTTSINNYLKNYREIRFKAGTYKLTAPLVVWSNTNIVCEPGVVFKRMHKGRTLTFKMNSSTAKYAGTHDVTWKGGKIIANTNTAEAIVVLLCHCKNITFDGLEVQGCVGLHSFEINSSKGVTIKNCIIRDQTADEDSYHKEGIQIDFAFKKGLSLSGAAETSPCYDGTHCSNIKITGCKFINCPTGIGTHTVSEKEDYHTNITIKNCTFEGIKKNAIRLLGMKDVTISKCKGKIKVDKTNKVYPLVGAKKTIKEYRYNQNVTIDGELYLED